MNIGLRTGLRLDAGRKSWAGDGPRPVRWTAWYPASEDAVATDEEADDFIIGSVARDAGLADGSLTYPMILLSHGTGGTALALSWLATRLAGAGYIVIGPDHHGNTASERYHPAGFAAWWERGRDLTFLLDALSTDLFVFGNRARESATARRLCG